MNKNNLQLDFLSKKKDVLSGLNDEQKKAVTHKNGPLLIIAGAGTGKTAVITRRIAHIIEQKWAHSSEILALTFTEKAAAEMEERVDQLVPYGFTDIWVSTFHAFGDRILRDYAINLGLPANFKVLTSTEQAIFMKQNIFAFDLNHFRPLANPLSHIRELLTHFSRLKDELIEPEKYLALAEQKLSEAKNGEESIEAEKTLELAKAYDRYNELMLQSGNLDFGDQIFLTYKLLKNDKKTLSDCQKKFKYILVDEFQDTNYAQNELTKLLAGKKGNITVVGDDDQSIYRFRGAAISNILDFKKDFKNCKEIVLRHNYRSTKEILASAYKLIQNNNPDRLEVANNINKKLISDKNGQPPELIFCNSLSCEADMVVEKIKELKNSGGNRYKDFAILVRANNHADPFIQSLNIAGIPYVFSGASGLFQQSEIKFLVAFLKALSYPDDNLAIYQLATSEIYQVSHNTMSELYTLAKRKNRNILNIAKNSVADDENIKKLTDMISDIEKFKERKNDPVGEVLYDYLTKTGYLKKISKSGSLENEFKIINISKFFDRIAAFNHASENRDFISFLENLELIIEFGNKVVSSDIDPDIDAVNILTVHSAKGLEWPIVFVVNCVSDRFPTKKKREQLPIPDELISERLPSGDWHLQEERRLFYVAITRAKKYLFLTAAEDYGGKRAKKLSQFVLETLGEVDSKKLKHKLSPEEKIVRFKKLPERYAKIPNAFKTEIISLSRQQIDDYFSCPKKFYYAHIIKIPLLENQQLMYGTAVHSALNHYYLRKISGENPTLEQLHSDFKNAFRNVGFITREQEELRFNQGIKSLARFYDQDQKENRYPDKIEEPFEFSFEKTKIRGRFDLVYREGEEAEIRDFKTSDVKEQKDADRRISISTQMMMYSLAWKEKYGQIPCTSLFFIESGLKGEKKFSDNDLEKTKEMISAVSLGIKKEEFSAKPNQRQCSYCPYKDICPDAV